MWCIMVCLELLLSELLVTIDFKDRYILTANANTIRIKDIALNMSEEFS